MVVQRLRGRSAALRLATAGLFMCFLVGVAFSQTGSVGSITRSPEGGPEGEFHLMRVKYQTSGGGGSHGLIQPWWAIDYPLAEEHFFAALRRVTKITVADEEPQLELTDKRIFQYPFMILQQPGRGYWNPTKADADNLREYLARGGFLLVDDFHAENDWAIFAQAIHRVLPDRPIVEIPLNDPLMHVFYDLDRNNPIPGKRHLRRLNNGEIIAQMQGEPSWRGIYDDKGRVMVAINFNSDMGDSWEHADDPEYPVPMTAQGYKFGVNYVVYAMSH